MAEGYVSITIRIRPGHMRGLTNIHDHTGYPVSELARAFFEHGIESGAQIQDLQCWLEYLPREVPE